MIRSYIANIQIRLQMVENCIGGIQNYKEQNIKQVKNKSAELISKLHKDIQRKFQKVKKVVEKYGDALDAPTTPKQKQQIVLEDLQQLKQITSHLDAIQKYLPSLDTKVYSQIRAQGQNIDYLLTASQIQVEDTLNSLKIKKYDQKSLFEIRKEHREQINELMQLNNRIVNNLNSKLELLIKKAMK